MKVIYLLLAGTNGYSFQLRGLCRFWSAPDPNWKTAWLVMDIQLNILMHPSRGNRYRDITGMTREALPTDDAGKLSVYQCGTTSLLRYLCSTLVA